MKTILQTIKMILIFFAILSLLGCSSSVKLTKNVVIVDKKGHGDFTTIMDAINSVKDSASNPVTIIIYPGTYEESVYVGGERHISLIGVNKYECIIKNSSGLYENAPLEIMGDAYIANLTIYATWTEENVVINNNGNYAVHSDYTGEGKTEFFNCIIISDSSAAIGAGLHNNQTLIFNNCYIESKSKTNYKSQWAHAIFIHGSAIPTDDNQKVIFKNCEIRGTQTQMIFLANVGSEFDATFINNMIWSTLTAKSNTNILFEGIVNITGDSYGNNIGLLNK